MFATADNTIGYTVPIITIIRNKIKRRLRNMMNEALKKIKINLNYSYLLIARKSVLEDEYNFIKIKLFSELKKIR